MKKYVNADVYFELIKINFVYLDIIQDVDIKAFKRAVSKHLQDTIYYNLQSSYLFWKDTR